MLASFSVSNFKSFNKPFLFNLEKNNKYEFNTNSIRDGVVFNALIYGQNGVGKSNLGLAIFDITHHLTDFQKNEEYYVNYLNADSDLSYAHFSYKFKFRDNIVRYEYKKSVNKILIYEKLLINEKVVAQIDRSQSSTAIFNLKGAESLNTNITNDRISIVKYLKFNSVLEKNEENDIFLQFYSFIEGMLFFRSVNSNMYIGLDNDNADIQAGIIDNDNVQDFERFLNKAGVECKLSYTKDANNKVIFFEFDTYKIPFYSIASTGTQSLTLFYYWLKQLEANSKASFIFIDEFDAYYHHSLSLLIIEKLKASRFQFILTTHNTSTISNEILRPDCYFLMNKNKIKSLSSSTSKELREAHNIEKMYKAGAFNV